MNTAEIIEKLDSGTITPEEKTEIEEAFNGKLIQGASDPLYFVMERKLRHIEHYETFQGVFTKNATIIKLTDSGVNLLDKGEVINGSTCLFSGTDSDMVFLLIDGKKRHVTSPTVMSYCCFDWGKIIKSNQIIADAVPMGDVINYGEE